VQAIGRTQRAKAKARAARVAGLDRRAGTQRSERGVGDVEARGMAEILR
jgi:hypothetical protein